SGLFHFRIAAGSRCGDGTAAVGCLWLATRSLPQRRRTADLQWDRAGDGAERETEVGAFPLGLSQVPAAKFSRMGRSLDCAIGLGPSLLSTTTRSGQRPPCSSTSVGVQMDSHSIPLLERSGRL